MQTESGIKHQAKQVIYDRLRNGIQALFTIWRVPRPPQARGDQDCSRLQIEKAETGSGKSRVNGVPKVENWKE